jgi:hypothetical protein
MRVSISGHQFGPKLSEVYVANETGVFKRVLIKQMGKMKPINCWQFFKVLPIIFKVDQ